MGPTTASCSVGTGVISREGNRPGHGVDHSTPSGTEIQNEWSYASDPLVCRHDVDRDKFTYLILIYLRSHSLANSLAVWPSENLGQHN